MRIDTKTKTVTLTNRFVVEFLISECNNEPLLKACESMLEIFCRNAKEFMEKHASEENNKQEVSKVMRCLKTFEKRMQQQLDDMSYNMDEFILQTKTQVTDAVNTQISGLLLAISQTITSTMEKLNVDSISKEIGERLKETLSSSSKEMQQVGYEIEKDVRKAHEHMSEQMITIIRNVTNGSGIEHAFQKLQDVQSNWNLAMHNVTDRLKSIEDKMNEEQRMVTSRYAEQREQLKTMPLVTKVALKEVMNNVEQESLNVSRMLQESCVQLTKLMREVRDNKESINFVRDKTERITSHVSNLENQLLVQQTKSQHNSSNKGKEAEEKLFKLLQDRLMSRDGYTVTQVCRQSMSCDITVERKEHPCIRIESKAYGKENGDKVKSAEVKKFERDLIQMNDHGIFVSLYSGIVGIGNIEIQQLPTGKFAVYLGNNNYDVDMIIDMVQLLYKLDKACCRVDDGNETRLSLEAISRIQGYLNDYNTKIQKTKIHLKESIGLLSEIQLDLIEKVLLGQKEVAKVLGNTPDDKRAVQCEHCGRHFQSIQGMSSHKRTCKGVSQRE